MNIRIKLILAIGIATIVLNVFYSIVVTQQGKTLWMSHYRDMLSERLDYTAVLVNLFFGRIENNLVSLSKDSDIIAGLTDSNYQKKDIITQKLDQFKNIVVTVESVGIHTTKDGRCIVVFGDESAQNLVGQDFSDRDYCKGILESKKPYISTVFTSKVTGNPAVGLAVPVQNDKGEMVGYIVGIVKLQDLRGYLWDLQNDESISVLFDRNNLPIVHTFDKEEDYQKYQEELLQLHEKGNEGFFETPTYLYGYKTVQNMVIVIGEPSKNIRAFLLQINQLIIPLNLASAGPLLLVAFIIIGTVTQRLERLTAIAKNISQDQKDAAVDPSLQKSSDEVGVLSRTVAGMVESIRQSQENLEKKVEERTHDLEKLNSYMTDRELKMIEMKKEIEQLKQS